MTLEQDIDGEDYINASWTCNQKVIATQGPLPRTIVHFLQMIVEQKIDAVVMLSKTSEKNKYGKNVLLASVVAILFCCLILNQE